MRLREDVRLGVIKWKAVVDEDEQVATDQIDRAQREQYRLHRIALPDSPTDEERDGSGGPGRRNEEFVSIATDSGTPPPKK